MKRNVSGTPLKQLVESYDKVKSYPGVLVVIVGHHEHKLLEAISIFDKKAPKSGFKVAVVCNGDYPDKLVSDGMPDYVEAVIYRDNSGWDIAMYAEAVLRYKFDYYWFMNDDIWRIKDGSWLPEFVDKASEPDTGFVAVQAGCPYNFRTSYFGASRLNYLTWLTAIHYGVIKKDSASTWRQGYRARTMNRVPGWVQAKEFELYNMTFTHVCNKKVAWLDNTRHFIDYNARRRKAFLTPPSAVVDLSKPRVNVASVCDIPIEHLWRSRQITREMVIESADRNGYLFPLTAKGNKSA